MFRSWKIARLFGIDVHVHPTFFILPVLMAISVSQAGPGAVLFMLTLLVAMFTCVVMHEYGHALVARRYGIDTVNITLYPIGGVASLARSPDRPSEELWVALAGPAVNVVIAALLTPLLFLLFSVGAVDLNQYEVGPMSGPAATAFSFLASLWAVNVMLVVFNMLPTFPMDGGRVFRALLSMKFGPLRATQAAVVVGRVIIGGAFCLLVVFAPGYFLRNPLSLILAGFVLWVGQRELEGVRHRERRRVSLVDGGTAPPLAESITVLNPRGFSGVTWDPYTGSGVRWEDGRPVEIFRG
jgi:Zn-dependent protease